jgi:serine protease Do
MAFEAFGEVTERLRRATVLVQSGRRGSGSGVIWSAGGLIVTNAHVVRASSPVVHLWDGRRLPARILQNDPARDLATLQISADGLPAAPHGDSSALRPGELVIAAGNPLGFVGAVSTGVIHRVDRHWVMSDVRLAPGNSGGPLANARGEVVGINTMIAGGLGLAIPSNAVDGEDQTVLGITVHPADLPGEAGYIGFVVLEVVSGSSADGASLRQGDVLVGADGVRFRDIGDLQRSIAAARGTLAIQFRRGSSSTTRTAVAQMAKQAARAA